MVSNYNQNLFMSGIIRFLWCCFYDIDFIYKYMLEYQQQQQKQQQQQQQLARC